MSDPCDSFQYFGFSTGRRVDMGCIDWVQPGNRAAMFCPKGHDARRCLLKDDSLYSDAVAPMSAERSSRYSTEEGERELKM